MSGRLRTVTVLASLGGAILFGWALRQAQPGAVFAGIKRVGAGIVIVIALGGVRSLARTAAWRLCLDAEDQLTFRSMFAAYLAGDAIGNVTPFGLLASEASKVVMLRQQLAMPASVASLTVENLCYTATVVVMLLTGTATLLMSFVLPRPFEIMGMIVLCATSVIAVVIAAGATWIVATRRRVVSGTIEWLARRGLAPRVLSEKLPQIRQTGDRIFGFVARHPRSVIPVFLLEASYHVAAVVEIWFALGLITGAFPHVLTAFVLEAVNRTITIVFQFVPIWLGVDEAGTMVVATAVGLGSAAGMSLALVRKTREVIWTVIGLILMTYCGLSIRGAMQTRH